MKGIGRAESDHYKMAENAAPYFIIVSILQLVHE